MKDERLRQLLRTAAEEYHRPPEVPRERMWARIRERRAAARRPATRWRWWPAAVAAALAAGILLGRWMAGGPDAPAEGPAGPQGAAAVPAARRPAPWAGIEAPYLGRAEALLTLVSRDPEGMAAAPLVIGRAEELLTETRLWLAAPVRDDEELRVLLEDLELVLVQIVRLSDRSPVGNGAWARENIDRRALLPRLRQRIPPGDPGTGI
jgi:hypothetical protein